MLLLIVVLNNIKKICCYKQIMILSTVKKNRMILSTDHFVYRLCIYTLPANGIFKQRIRWRPGLFFKDKQV